MRSFVSGVVALFRSFEIPALRVAVATETSGYRWTSHHSDVTMDGETYSPAVLELRDVAQNLSLRAPSALLRVVSLDASLQEDYDAGLFNVERVTITQLYYAAGVVTPSGLVTTWRVARPECNGNEIRLSLSSTDAVQGTTVPRYQTQTEGCQRRYRIGGCWVRPAMTEGAAFPNTEAALTCDKTLRGPNGCASKLPDVGPRGLPYEDGDSERVVIPKPIAAFPGRLARANAGRA